MRILFAVLLCAMQGCLMGCEIKPMPADKLFAFSNPAFTADIPGFGKARIPTNAQVDLDYTKPDGTIVKVKIKSNASKVITAEGERVDSEAVTAQRSIDEMRVVEQSKLEVEKMKIWATFLGPVRDALVAKLATPLEPVMGPPIQ
jgi:hypothetical protein